MKFRLLLLFTGLLLVCCVKDEQPVTEDFFDLLPGIIPPMVPADNQLTADRVKLGKMLFYDKGMSRDSTISCATCHKAELAFTDGLPKSKGIGGTQVMRNAPTLSNVAYFPRFLSEGAVPTLEQQILVPIMEHNEFDTNILTISEKLNRRKDIVELSLRAYGRLPDPYVITRSIAAFERTIISLSSPYDYYTFGKNTKALSPKQIAGKELFFSARTNCALCHTGTFFTNFSFQNNGLYKQYLDEGRKRLTGKPQDEALFKVPTLRNVEITGPYMHDGSLKTLEEVVEHYNKGGAGHVNQSEFVKPLHLTQYEKECLVDFLKSLTDFKLISNKKYKI